jgi:hypothetical protein
VVFCARASAAEQASCHLGTTAHPLKHIVYLQFGNVHLRRDNRSSTLLRAAMPSLKRGRVAKLRWWPFDSLSVSQYADSTSIVLSRELIDSCHMLRALVVLIVGAVPFWAAAAKASLGGDAASVLSDSTALRGVLRTTGLTAYDIHDIDAGTDLRVREFVRRDGTVFALSWSGTVPPDLPRLLGASFEAYAAALAAINHPGVHRSVRVALPGLVVESGGHLRAYSGRAYLPALIPAGIRAVDLR